MRQTVGTLVRARRFAILIAALVTWPALGNAQSAEPVSPSRWLYGGAGIGVTQGGAGYAATLAWLPSAGFGFRFSDRYGVELGATFIRQIFGNRDELLVEASPPPPGVDGVAASLVAIAGSSTFPFNNVLGFGMGAYREKDGVNRTNFGVEGYLETLWRPASRGTSGLQLRLIVLPNASAGMSMTLGAGFSLRSRQLGF